MKTAIVIGASTGIGRELAKSLGAKGWSLVLCARRLPLLEELKKELEATGVTVRVQALDISQVELCRDQFKDLLESSSAELVVVNAGVSLLNKELDWEKEYTVMMTNALGAGLCCTLAMKYFLEKGRGHLVGISSVAGIRGLPAVPAYSATKAFLINYLEALSLKAQKSGKPIYVTDIRPGFIDTPMTEGQKNMFWLITAKEGAKLIVKAIEAKKEIAYVPGKWDPLATVMAHAPRWLLAKLP